MAANDRKPKPEQVNNLWLLAVRAGYPDFRRGMPPGEYVAVMTKIFNDICVLKTQAKKQVHEL